MGYQVIQQPNGKLALFGSGTDTWAVYDATADEVVEQFAKWAADDARRSARRIVDLVLAGKARDAYYQFAMTFGEANAKSREHGGVVITDHLGDPNG